MDDIFELYHNYFENGITEEKLYTNAAYLLLVHKVNLCSMAECLKKTPWLCSSFSFNINEILMLLCSNWTRGRQKSVTPYMLSMITSRPVIMHTILMPKSLMGALSDYVHAYPGEHAQVHMHIPHTCSRLHLVM